MSREKLENDVLVLKTQFPMDCHKIQSFWLKHGYSSAALVDINTHIMHTQVQNTVAVVPYYMGVHAKSVSRQSESSAITYSLR